jgi:hypothetical protein
MTADSAGVLQVRLQTRSPSTSIRHTEETAARRGDSLPTLPTLPTLPAARRSDKTQHPRDEEQYGTCIGYFVAETILLQQSVDWVGKPNSLGVWAVIPEHDAKVGRVHSSIDGPIWTHGRTRAVQSERWVHSSIDAPIWTHGRTRADQSGLHVLGLVLHVMKNTQATRTEWFVMPSNQ